MHFIHMVVIVHVMRSPIYGDQPSFFHFFYPDCTYLLPHCIYLALQCRVIAHLAAIVCFTCTTLNTFYPILSYLILENIVLWANSS